MLGMVAGVTTAGSMGPVCKSENVTVPCKTKLWDFGVQALYLKSVYGAEKAVLGSETTRNEVKNNWNWGYRLEGSYHVNTGNDVTLNWMHFSTSTDPENLTETISIPRFIQPTTAPFELVSRNRIDQVNAVMGQHSDLSVNDKLRVYAGLQYANIQSTATNYFSITVPIPNESLSLFDNTDYKGVGPVMGVNYAYNITDLLSLTANGSGSILYGTNRYHAGFVLSPAGVILEQVYSRKKGVVPSLEAKLGLNYVYATSLFETNIQVGYQAVNYFNVLEAQSLQNFNNLVQSLDYGLFGPYFGLKLIGNV